MLLFRVHHRLEFSDLVLNLDINMGLGEVKWNSLKVSIREQDENFDGKPDLIFPLRRA